MIHGLEKTHVLSHWMFSWREQEEGLNDTQRDVQLIVETKLKIKSSDPIHHSFIHKMRAERTFTFGEDVDFWISKTEWVLSVIDISQHGMWWATERHCVHKKPMSPSFTSWPRRRTDSSLGNICNLRLLMPIHKPSQTSFPCSPLMWQWGWVDWRPRQRLH